MQQKILAPAAVPISAPCLKPIRIVTIENINQRLILGHVFSEDLCGAEDPIQKDHPHSPCSSAGCFSMEQHCVSSPENTVDGRTVNTAKTAIDNRQQQPSALRTTRKR